jgi:hypothetical protein
VFSSSTSAARTLRSEILPWCLITRGHLAPGSPAGASTQTPAES